MSLRKPSRPTTALALGHKAFLRQLDQDEARSDKERARQEALVPPPVSWTGYDGSLIVNGLPQDPPPQPRLTTPKT